MVNDYSRKKIEKLINCNNLLVAINNSIYTRMLYSIIKLKYPDEFNARIVSVAGVSS